MNTTGIVRKVDDLGRIVLPAEMRRLLEKGAVFMMSFIIGGMILLSIITGAVGGNIL